MADCILLGERGYMIGLAHSAGFAFWRRSNIDSDAFLEPFGAKLCLYSWQIKIVWVKLFASTQIRSRSTFVLWLMIWNFFNSLYFLLFFVIPWHLQSIVLGNPYLQNFPNGNSQHYAIDSENSDTLRRLRISSNFVFRLELSWSILIVPRTNAFYVCITRDSWSLSVEL